MFILNVLSYVLGLFCKGQNGAHVMETTTTLNLKNLNPMIFLEYHTTKYHKHLLSMFSALNL
jgi:hypothetical protein